MYDFYNRSLIIFFIHLLYIYENEDTYKIIFLRTNKALNIL